MKILFGRPDSVNPELRNILERFFLKRNTGYLPTKAHQRYIVFQTSLSLLCLSGFIFFYEQLPLPECIFISFFLLVSLVNTGAMLEQRSWIFYLEFSRISLVLLYTWTLSPHLATSVCVISISSILLYYFRPMERHYKRLLYQQVNS